MESKVREGVSLIDFKRVYRVFSGPPYNEKYTDEELQEIYDEYKEKGYIYGVYAGEVCAGIIALERGSKKDQPVSFQDDETMYLADIAVLNRYRKTGLGTQLMLFGVMQSKALGYKRIYMRTLENGSMSYGIARKIGFVPIEGVSQAVERERTDGGVSSVNNIFLELDLDRLDRNAIRRGIQEVSMEREKKYLGEEL